MNQKKKKVYRSINEFEKKFLPKAYKERIAEKPRSAQGRASSEAKEALDKIRDKLSR